MSFERAFGAAPGMTFGGESGIAAALRPAAHMPGVAAKFAENDGHFSVVMRSLGQIVDFLKARA